jgi:hypothetical protein
VSTTKTAEAVARRFVDALGRRDPGAMSAELADDVVYHFPGRSPVAGTYRGRDEVMGLFGAFGRVLGGPPETELHDLTVGSDHVVELATHRAARDGRAFEWRAVRVYHVRDGRIAEIWLCLEDQYALDEYLA